MKLYKCDPNKNHDCTKTNCYINGGECDTTTHEEYEMENEIRYYLKMILACMTDEEGYNNFEPSYIVTAVKLPTGAIEIAVNNQNIKEKIEYILETYDEEMRHKNDPAVVMQNIMVV